MRRILVGEPEEEEEGVFIYSCLGVA